jgi:Sortase domain
MAAGRRTPSTAVGGAAVLAFVLACAGCTASSAGPGVGAPTAAAATTTGPPSSTPASGSNSSAPEQNPSTGPSTAIHPVPSGELVAFRAEHDGTTIIDAQSSGLALYNTSESCEVPGQPCYDAPTFDKIARIDLGAPPQVPGTDTTFVTGHSNRYHPDDPKHGVFSRLQDVRTGDTLVLTTTKGVFTYAVNTVLTVPFDKLTTTDEVVRVRPDTVVAISCVVAPDRASYLGNYVVVGTLEASAPR